MNILDSFGHMSAAAVTGGAVRLWLLAVGEPLPIGATIARLHRIGMLATRRLAERHTEER